MSPVIAFLRSGRSRVSVTIAVGSFDDQAVHVVPVPSSCSPLGLAPSPAAIP